MHPMRVRLVLAAVCLAGACHKGGPAPAETAEPAPAAEASPAAAQPQGPAPTQDEAGARQAFETYRTTVLARDGAGASKLVDRRTLEVYQQYLELALTIDRAALLQLDWMAKFVVLRLRHEFDRAALTAMTGASLFVHSIERGWISDTSVREAVIAEVTIDGPRAGLALTQSQKVPVFFFVWEPDGWKFSLWKTMAMAEPVMQKMFADSGQKDELAWIVGMLEAISPKRFDPAMIDGPPG